MNFLRNFLEILGGNYLDFSRRNFFGGFFWGGFFGRNSLFLLLKLNLKGIVALVEILSQGRRGGRTRNLDP
jgi:hypothetical protein